MASRNSSALYNLPGKIRETRKSLGMTQTELGLAMGSNKAAVSKIELGQKIPDLTTLANAADAMNISLSDLLGRAESDDPYMVMFKERMARIPPDKRAAFETMIEAAFALAGV